MQEQNQTTTGVQMKHVGQTAVPRYYGTFESRGFNMNQTEQVEQLKIKAAELFELITNISVPPDNREVGRLVSLAKTELESSIMWAVKAYSRQ